MADTIAAIATPLGEGGVGIVRVSGPNSLSIMKSIYRECPDEVIPRHVYYGHAVDNHGTVIDDMVAIYMKAPHTFTGDDVVEFQAHGSNVSLRLILRSAISAGARLADPGEFTKNAFLNGRLDLSQAEGINDLIWAKDEINAKSAIHSLKGSVAKLMRPLEEDLTQIISNIEVNIDYPEYDDVLQLTEEEILPKAEKWIDDIHQIIVTAQQSAVIKEGINTVILGRPNVGKSSLLNALLEEDKAIVTDVAGTTRDLVEGTVRLNGITLNLIDTAGIRKSDDAIEQIGITKSLQALEKAQLVIVVLDGSEELTEEDQELLEKTKNHNRIVVYNKKDKDSMHAGISISAIQKDITELTNAIVEKYHSEYIAANSDTLNNERQIGYALQAEQAMNDAVNALHAGMELDLVTIDLEKAWTALRQITGKAGKEDLLDEIFSRFCLGK